jgi:hypothetical protein
MTDYAKSADCNQVVHDHVLPRTVHMIYLAVDGGFAKVDGWFRGTP